eukprot:11860697-Ditylum_brightwellii.AAC.1
MKKLEGNYQITLLQDLALLDKANIDVLLGNDMATFIAQRKLSMIANLLKQGGVVNSSTIMNGIVTCGGIVSGTTDISTLKATAPIKLSPADFPSFSGEIKDQEDCKTEAEAQIGQTNF